MVDYTTTLYQALPDLSDWAERGIAPPQSSNYEVADGQVVLAADGRNRHGIQPVATVRINREESAEIKPGERATIQVTAVVPKGTGRVVRATWCLDESKQFTHPVDMKQATYSADGEEVTFDTTISYERPGTYFPTVKIFSERNGDANTPYTCIANLGKVRVIVKE